MTDDIARCIGKGHDGPGGEMLHSQCWECARRSSASVEVSPMRLIWIAPPKQEPCPERIERN